MIRDARVLVAATAACLSGLTLLVAQPPLGLWPATFLSAPLLLVSVAAELEPPAGRRPRSFRWGWLAGVVAYGPMLTWLIAPAGVLAWALLVAIQAAFLGLVAVLVRPTIGTTWVVAAMPILWAGMDAWRGVFPLGGFEWGALAYAHVDGSWMLPTARLVGGRGITVLTVLIGTLLFEAGRRMVAARGPDGTPLRQARAGLPQAQRPFVGLAAALLVSVMATIEPPPETGETLDVLAVQGNDLEVPYAGEPGEEDRLIADAMRRLTEAAVAAGGPPELTVWPESSVDRDAFGDAGADLRPLIASTAAATRGGLVIGINRAGERPRTFLNSAVEVDAAGEPVEAYVKRQLVPFGEYVPFRSVIGDLPPLRQVSRDAVPGGAAAGLEVAGVPIAVAICFETLFPELVRQNVIAGDADAQLVLASTNDASFGRSAEPQQHLAQSRLRAVETGRWVVHAALSGASAFVSPDGRAHDVTDLFAQTTIRREVPLVQGRTPFLVIGDVLGTGVRLLTAGWALWVLVRYLGRSRRGPSPASRPPAPDPSEAS